MDDDLNISPALAAVFDLVRELNRRHRRPDALDGRRAARRGRVLRDLDRVLGDRPTRPAERRGRRRTLAALLEARAAARGGAGLGALGPLCATSSRRGASLVEDTRDGQRWRRTEQADGEA